MGVGTLWIWQVVVRTVTRIIGGGNFGLCRNYVVLLDLRKAWWSLAGKLEKKVNV